MSDPGAPTRSKPCSASSTASSARSSPRALRTDVPEPLADARVRGPQNQCEEVSMSPKKETQKAARSTTASNNKSKGFTAEERAAIKERAKELKAEAAKADGESALLAKIAEMKGRDRAMAKRLHAIVKANAPELSPKTWYGMPAYARDGKVVCFFKSAEKFKSRYATLGFSDEANLDKGAMWPTDFALQDLTDTEEAKI